MSYYLRYENKDTYVSNEGEVILKVIFKGSWLGPKAFYKVYKKDTLILVSSYYSFLFTKRIIIEENNTNEILQFEKRDQKFVLNYKNDIYFYKKSSFQAIIKGLPIFNLFKNGKEIGNISLLKKFSVGGGTLFKIDFKEEDASNIYQMVLFIVTEQQSLFG